MAIVKKSEKVTLYNVVVKSANLVNGGDYRGRKQWKAQLEFHGIQSEFSSAVESLITFSGASPTEKISNYVSQKNTSVILWATSFDLVYVCDRYAIQISPDNILSGDIVNAVIEVILSNHEGKKYLHYNLLAIQKVATAQSYFGKIV